MYNWHVQPHSDPYALIYALQYPNTHSVSSPMLVCFSCYWIRSASRLMKMACFVCLLMWFVGVAAGGSDNGEGNPGTAKLGDGNSYIRGRASAALLYSLHAAWSHRSLRRQREICRRSSDSRFADRPRKGLQIGGQPQRQRYGSNFRLVYSFIRDCWVNLCW